MTLIIIILSIVAILQIIDVIVYIAMPKTRSQMIGELGGDFMIPGSTIYWLLTRNHTS